MAADVDDPSPAAVLFACNYNRVRSAIAEALLKMAVGKELFVDSCGLTHPASLREEDGDALAADPFAQAVMAEVGYDLSWHRAKTFDELEDTSFDLVISLTPESQDRAVELSRARASKTEYWPVADPTLVEGSREVRLAAYRQVRDDLRRRIGERFGAMASAPIDLPPPGAL